MSWFWGKNKEEQSEKQASSEVAADLEAQHVENGLHNDVALQIDAGHDLAGTIAIHSVALERQSFGKVDDRSLHDSTDDDADADETSSDDETDDDEDEAEHLPMSFESRSTDEDDISVIDDSSHVDSLDDDFLDSSHCEEDDPRSPESGNDDHHSDSDDSEVKIGRNQRVTQNTNSSDPAPAAPTDNNDSEHPQDDKNSEETDNEEEVPTSFWEKQSLLVLAAEHDRVDILKAILSDDDEEKDKLMNGGVPPLHLAITFGSVNATQSLLRMGADPSVRPNVDEILEQQKDQPDDSKVEIANIRRFDGVSAWELAFGNKAYERMSKTATSWSLFGHSSSSMMETGSKTAANDEISSTRVVKPVDMAPSKREGVRHAFTAEALRCVGGDESERLQQLVGSGMPATIDIGGKDLYSWAVEMGALQCEELLRPSEAAKYEDDGDSMQDNGESLKESLQGEAVNTDDRKENLSSSFVIHRPADETIAQLVNRLDELESLSTALSICLDNLAEEVSVCHGLLLMGGGASALASHVKSLKALKTQKLDQLEQVQTENDELEKELVDLIQSSGEIGTEIFNLPAFTFFSAEASVLSSGGRMQRASDSSTSDTEVDRRNLMAQIAASESKIRKLRASIADLSEENIRDLKAVQMRGLEGGINLVRGLREEIRDIDFQLDGARSMKREFRTKIGMIHARIPTASRSRDQANGVGERRIHKVSLLDEEDDSKPKVLDEPREDRANSNVTLLGVSERSQIVNSDKAEGAMPSAMNGAIRQKVTPDVVGHKEECEKPLKDHAAPTEPLGDPLPPEKAAGIAILNSGTHLTPSERIATGHSKALAIVPPGNRGFFTVDLWQVLLRIMGYERASYRRGVQVATSQPNVMIV